MRQIAIYGKGGIGKSTIVSNISASLAAKGYSVMQIGCDPKGDSTRALLHGKRQTRVLEMFRKMNEQEMVKISTDSIIKRGYNGVMCLEAGGPEPGIGCAGRGIIRAINLLEKMNVFNKKIDFVFYDVLGDVVCGGFAMPIRSGYAREIYLVVSGEFMALYAANNICKGIKRFSSVGGSRLGGIICNSRNIEKEHKIVSDFAKRIGSHLISFIPFEKIVQDAEHHRKTVIEYAKDSKQTKIYSDLAEKIVNNKNLVIPKPLTEKELDKIVKW